MPDHNEVKKFTKSYSNSYTYLCDFILLSFQSFKARTTDTQWWHKSKKPENLGQWGRQNMLRPYPQIWAMLWSRFPQRASVVRVSKDDSIVKLQCFETSNDEIYKRYFAPLWPAVEPIEFIFYLDHNFTKIEWSRQNRLISLNLNKSDIPSLVWQNVGIDL